MTFSACLVLYHMAVLVGRPPLCGLGPLSFELIYLRPKTCLASCFPWTDPLRPFAGCNAILNGLK